VFATADGPCYRCLFREPPPPGAVPSCAVAGVFGVLPGLVGAVQATETLKLLLGLGDTLAGRLLLMDALRMQMRTIALRRDPQCPACGTREIRELIDYEAFCAGPAHEADAIPEVTPRELAEKLRRGDDFDLIDVREPHEHAYARIEGARLVPLAAVPRAAASLDPSRELVLYCHHGMRSLAAAERLRELGFARVVNLAGGIDRWSAEVDPKVRRY
jgi:sulfur-carrier protein adenylyltransferase/sulfurtransferase